MKLLGVTLLLALGAVALPAGTMAEQASQPSSAAAGQLDAGGQHTCALAAGGVRCWGLAFSGQLGYGNRDTIGDNEAPGSVGPVDLGSGRTATAISAGDLHTCARLDNGTVRCWGFGGNGRLGYANTNDIGDNESPGSVGPVDLGSGRTATAISAGGAHTCALLDNGSVRCWGFAADARLGYAMPNAAGRQEDIGDDESPGSVGPVDLGPGRTALAISAGSGHTCALLDDGNVRCWGSSGTLFGGDGRLGYGVPALQTVGDDETPGEVDPVDLGPGRTAVAISAGGAFSGGGAHTCVVLDNGGVRCWGFGTDGRLGYGNAFRIGDNETPGSVGPVDLGPGRTATAISAGGSQTCARLDDGTLRCWGDGTLGRLGYANTSNVGDNEKPGSLAPVDLGAGRTATAVSAGGSHTCARLDDTSFGCWGEGLLGRLGYGNEDNIGDTETPGAAGSVDFNARVSIADATMSEGASGGQLMTFTVTVSPATGVAASVAYATSNETAAAPADYTARRGTLSFAAGDTSKPITVPVRDDTLDETDERFRVSLSNPDRLTIADPAATGTIVDDDTTGGTYGNPRDPPDTDAAALKAEASRLRGLRGCLAKASRHARREIRRGRRLKGSRRARVRRHAKRHKSRLRRACLKRWGRTPGPVAGLTARAVSASEIVLSFSAAGTDGTRAPAARTYVVKQSIRPLRGARDFRRAQALCDGVCRFPTTRVGGAVTLRVTDLRPRTTYHYAVVARDNVSRRLGPRSRVATARTE